MMMAAAVEQRADSAPVVDHAIKCWRCTRKLAEYAARPWQFTCARCKATNASPPAAAAAAKHLTP